MSSGYKSTALYQCVKALSVVHLVLHIYSLYASIVHHCKTRPEEKERSHLKGKRDEEGGETISNWTGNNRSYFV